MEIVVFGTGEYCQKYLRLLSEYEIVAFLDNDCTKQGQFFYGRKIFAPEAIVTMHYERVYILSIYVQEMRKQLLDIDVDEKHIFYVYDLRDRCGLLQRHTYLTKKQNEVTCIAKTIVLVSFGLDLSGAQIVLMYLAKILIKEGYRIHLMSPCDGVLRQSYLDMDVDVTIDEHLFIGRWNEIEYPSGASLVVVNTVRLYHLLLDSQLSIPIIWWLHEPDMLYLDVNPSALECIDYTHIHIFAVSQIARKSFLRYVPSADIQSMLFGIPDCQHRENKRCGSKITIAVIGGIEIWKGHDIFLKSFGKLSDEHRESCNVWFIGKYQWTNYFQEIYHHIKKYHVQLYGELEQKEILILYEKINILVIPSREETMSMVAIEGMMQQKVCIVSSNAGIAEYIRDKENGLVFKSGDIDSLAQQIGWAITHLERWNYIGKNARKTYEKYFSVKQFRIRFLRILRTVFHND